MGIALPGLLSTAMARQHLNLFAMWFAGGGVTQIFRMPRGRKQRFTHLRYEGYTTYWRVVHKVLSSSFAPTGEAAGDAQQPPPQASTNRGVGGRPKGAPGTKCPKCKQNKKAAAPAVQTGLCSRCRRVAFPHR